MTLIILSILQLNIKQTKINPKEARKCYIYIYIYIYIYKIITKLDSDYHIMYAKNDTKITIKKGQTNAGSQ